MLFCIPLIYSWLASHIYKDVYMIKTVSSHDWSQKLMSLTEIFYSMVLQKAQRIGDNLQLRELS